MSPIQIAETGLSGLFGTRDEHLRYVEKAFGVTIGARGGRVSVQGEEPQVSLVEKMLGELATLVEKGYRLKGSEIRTAIRVLQEDSTVSLVEFFEGTSFHQINPRSLSQRRYLEAMVNHDIVVSIGPAGTGKTFLAVAMAATALAEKKVRRIVLCRPAVEAGEKLGFLPGDLAEKVNPYLRPLHDALNDIIGFDKVGRMMERGIIEVAPIAFMRGRTLNESFVILDEAQNTTTEQMKMFLTRIGFSSKAVINGDITQTDLPPGRVSGLREAEEVLQGIDGIAFVRFSKRDVVRHSLVQKIVHAYELHENPKREYSGE